ncbi:MAG: hypothetical protein LIP03_04595 [Bacteroidales bacterium]|nr:hypothetical protein [Bacteroidales bacterium]
MKKILFTLALAAATTMAASAVTSVDDLVGTYTVTFTGEQYAFFNYDSYSMDYFEFSEEEENQFTVTVDKVDDNTIVINHFFGQQPIYMNSDKALTDDNFRGTVDLEAGTISLDVVEFGVYYYEGYEDYPMYLASICTWDDSYDLWGAPDEILPAVGKIAEDGTITFSEFAVVDLAYVDFWGSTAYVHGEDYIMVKDGGAGITGIIADQKDAPAYNLMGIRVDNTYRGIVIKNGKKYYKR